ncbi:MAG: DEAD/DEAH box helicase [Phycisphaerales bacterium]
MTFSDFRLAEPIVRAVAAEGYTTPTPIQKLAIPAVLAGRDVLGCAQTGTGKTCAFALPILHRLAESMTKAASSAKKQHNHRHGNNGHRGRSPRALVLCPTRELAMQIFDSFCAYGRSLGLRHTAVFGGVNQHRQVRDMRAGIDVLVATPGRLLDLVQQGVVDLSAIETLVLDEADRMLDMGFIHDIRKIASHMPERRQTLLFSATMPNEIRSFADSMLKDPVFVDIAPVQVTADAIVQSVYLVTRQNKPALLERVLRKDATGRALVFTRTKHGADRLVKQLDHMGIHAAAIHSNKSQNARIRALKAFKDGRVTVLIATDIASRGIDVDEITHVVNFDLPDAAETYVHRIGRTARAGATGIALTFCDHDELSTLRAIERSAGKTLKINRDEPDLTFDVRSARSSSPSLSPRSNGHSGSNSKPRRHRGARSGSNASGGYGSQRSDASSRSSTSRSGSGRKRKSSRGESVIGAGTARPKKPSNRQRQRSA